MGAADCVPRRLCVLLCLLFLTGHLTLAADAVGDVRRDATVRAVESIMPSVVNISTETLVQVNDPLQNMFRDFFGKQWGRNTKQSLGSGVIIDEDGYICMARHGYAAPFMPPAEIKARYPGSRWPRHEQMRRRERGAYFLFNTLFDVPVCIPAPCPGPAF